MRRKPQPSNKELLINNNLVVMRVGNNLSLIRPCKIMSKPTRLHELARSLEVTLERPNSKLIAASRAESVGFTSSSREPLNYKTKWTANTLAKNKMKGTPSKNDQQVP